MVVPPDLCWLLPFLLNPPPYDGFLTLVLSPVPTPVLIVKKNSVRARKELPELPRR
jgi:hypothetical protein